MSTRYQTLIEHRDRLYYDQYLYCLSFQQDELYCIRGLPGDAKLDSYINQRKHYESLGGSFRGQGTKFTPEVRERLHQTQAELLKVTVPFKLVVSGRYGSLYTNDTVLIDTMCELSYLGIGNVRTAVLSLPRDTVVIRNPEFQYRTYFREREVSEDRKATLINWLESQKDAVRPSPATRQWLKNSKSQWRSRYMQRYYYVEHDSLQYETMLSLVIPGLVRKTVPVVSSDK